MWSDIYSTWISGREKLAVEIILWPNLYDNVADQGLKLLPWITNQRKAYCTTGFGKHLIL